MNKVHVKGILLCAHLGLFNWDLGLSLLV